MNKTGTRLTLATLFGIALFATQAHATIVSVMGNGNILIPNITPNTGATANFFNDTGVNRMIHAWNEKQNATLGRDIMVDIVAPGVYSSPFISANATIARNTVVNSHLIFFDPLYTASGVAQFTFGETILGIIVMSDLPNDDRFLKSDFLGDPLTAYPGSHFNLRGIEFGPESLTLSPDLKTIRLDLSAADPGDQIRVITQGESAHDAPEPSTGILGSACVALAIARFRRHTVRV